MMKKILVLLLCLLWAVPAWAGFTLLPSDGLSGEGGGDPVDTLLDRDGDGLTDFVILRGDYNGDGSKTLEDIDAALSALTDTGPKLLWLQGVYDSSALTVAGFDWDATNLIEVAANTTILCDPGSRMYGPGLTFWVDRAAVTRLMANTTGADNIHIDGCFIENTELLTPFDPADGGGDDWGGGTGSEITSKFGGIHFDGCDNCSVKNTIVRGSPHSGFFATKSSNVLFDGNTVYATGEAFHANGEDTTLSTAVVVGDRALLVTVLPPNCTVDNAVFWETDTVDPLSKDPASPRFIWDMGYVTFTGVAPDTVNIRRAALAADRETGAPHTAAIGKLLYCVSGDKHGFEFYTEGGVIVRNSSMTNNKASHLAGVSFMIRGVSVISADCDTAGEIDCWHENVTISHNEAVDTLGELLMIRGVRGATLRDNFGFRTGGVSFVTSNQFCSEPWDGVTFAGGKFECSQDVRLYGNILRDTAPNSGHGGSVGAAVRFNNGHNAIHWDASNVIDGNTGGNAYALLGNVSRSYFGLTARNIASACLIDGLGSGSTSVPTDVVNFDWDFTWCGLEHTDTNGPVVAWRSAHTINHVVHSAKILGQTSAIVAYDPVNAGDDIALFDIHNFVFDGTYSGFSGVFATAALRDAAITCNGANKVKVVIIQDATSTSLCTGGGGFVNRCKCNGTTWVDLVAVAGRDSVWGSFGAGELATGGGLHNGTFVNVSSVTMGFVNLQSNAGGGTVSDFVIENVLFSTDNRMMVAAGGVKGIEEQQEGYVNLTVKGVRFDSIEISAADQYVGVEQSDFSGTSDWQDIDTAAGACSSGAQYQDTDATATGMDNVCRNSVWVARD